MTQRNALHAILRSFGTLAPTFFAPQWDTVALPAPPFSRYVSRDAQTGKTKSIRLTQLSAQKHSDVWPTDWYKRVGVNLPTYRASRGVEPNPSLPPLPAEIPPTYQNADVMLAIRHPSTIFALYGEGDYQGRYLIGLRASDYAFLFGYDFKNYAYAPGTDKTPDAPFTNQCIKWAEAVGDILYVSSFHRTYARSSRGMNGYITALRIPDGKILWRSDSLRCNTSNFVIAGDSIITGYGFTAEPDFLYVLDRNTGASTQTISLKTGPEIILRRDDRLFVHCYDTDYTFRIGAAN